MSTKGGDKGGHMGACRHGGMEMHTEPSSAARAILGGRGRGATGTRDADDTNSNGGAGKTMGTQRSAGNLNTRG